MNKRAWKPFVAPKSDHDRQFGLHPLDAPDEIFGPLAGFVAIWRGKCQGASLPAWSAFDFYDFGGWHGWIHVDEMVSDDPFEMRCRLWGTELTDRLGIDETGKPLSLSPAIVERDLIRFYSNILRLPVIGTNVGMVSSYGRVSEWTVVKLPCPGNGREPDVILSCSLQGEALSFGPEYLLTGR
ncbi:hypothetical protein NUH88_09405 [Nisaea acidiphila]|uniref:Uncharacterized protein n=1 Tax=Nisaea acidiphila TaxID=1862145 RepID=A0A9J7AX09_9PROT|nr:hypothetical protein [Nisaea acidiphila]UUX51903.1 hypothetical protein NUH88_09405 [Nisaea acidiphila]